MDDLEPELVEGAAMAAAYASGVSDWKHVSEHGDYDSREYWRRIASAVLAMGRPDLRAQHYAEALEMGFRAGCEAFEFKSPWANINDLWEQYNDQ